MFSGRFPISSFNACALKCGEWLWEGGGNYLNHTRLHNVFHDLVFLIKFLKNPCLLSHQLKKTIPTYPRHYKTPATSCFFTHLKKTKNLKTYAWFNPQIKPR